MKDFTHKLNYDKIVQLATFVCLFNQADWRLNYYEKEQ